MSKRSRRLKLDYLPHDIKAALIAKIMANTDSFQGTAQWLLDEHGVKVSPSAVWRFAKTVQTKHGGLLELGMSTDAIGAHVGKLEALGAFLVQREVLNQRIAGLLTAILSAPSETEGKHETNH